jgi:prolipoprotein diacylglyceryltransferase
MHAWYDKSQPVSAWGLAFLGALLVIWLWSRRNAAARGIDTSHMDLLVPLSIALGICGAWLLTELTRTRVTLFEISACGALAVLVYSRIARLGFRDLIDAMALPGLAGIAVGRVGCTIAGCCWGDVAALVPGIEYPPSSLAFEQHVVLGLVEPFAESSLPVHAVQLYEIFVLATVIALGLRIRWRNYAKGSIAFYAVGMYLLSRFLLEFLHATHEPLFANLTIVHLQCLGFLAVLILVRQLASAGQGHSNPPRAA